MNTYIRRATLDDKEAVLRINDNLYDGRDYLASYYDNLVGNELTVAYVAVCDGRIVAFALFSIVDDGRTMVSRAGRTHKQYAGRGFMARMGEMFWLDWPHLVQSFATVNTGYTYKKPGVKVIQTKTMYRFEPFTITQLRGLSSPRTLSMVTDMTWKMYMMEERLSSYLFPHDRILIDRVPFQLLESNIPLLRQTGGTPLMLTDVRIEDGTPKGLLSISIWYQIDKQACCNIDFFGTELTSLKLHITSHINTGRFMFPSNPIINMMIDFEKTVDVRDFDTQLTEFGLSRQQLKGVNGDITTTRIICERKNPAFQSKV